MDDPYTHTFQFKIKNSFIEGEVEFNTDNEDSYKIISWSEPIPGKILRKFNKLMLLLKTIYEEEGGINKIIIKKKGV